MNEEEFWISLKEMAHSTYSKYHAGTEMMLEFDEHFPKYVESNYRVEMYKKNHEFHMTANERYFDLIGFIDALAWISRRDLVDLEHLRSSINPFSDMSEKEAKKYNRMFKDDIRDAQCANKLYIWAVTGEFL